MIKANSDLRVILIGGSSNVGKSTIAQSLAMKLGWKCISTDSLARHPGRPWKVRQKPVPEHVIEHYSSLTIDELITDVLRHYRSMWSDIEALISLHATDPSSDRLVLEGSALWPESVATLDVENVGAIWLTAKNDLFKRRISDASRYEEVSTQERYLIQKFLGRTLSYNEKMMAAIKRLGLTSVDVEDSFSVDELSEMCLGILMP